MRFFDQQRAARRSTLGLVLAFGLTLALLLLTINGGLWLVWRLLSGWVHRPTYLPPYFYPVNTGMTLLFVLGGWWIEHSNLGRGGEAIARRCGARELRPERHPAEQRFGHVVTEMALAARMPVPQAMVVPRQWQINAFAVGHTPQDAAIAITDGALDALDRRELQGLVAHELSHIAEGDTRLSTQLCGMVFGLEMVFRFGQTLVRGDGDRGELSLTAIFGLPIMIVGSAGWLAGRLLCAAVSRQREYLADARAVQWTRQPDGLASVLRKIERQMREDWRAQSDSADDDDDTDWMSDDFSAFARHQPMIAHLLLTEPVRHGWSRRFGDLLSSHPPLRQRIARVYGVLD